MRIDPLAPMKPRPWALVLPPRVLPNRQPNRCRRAGGSHSRLGGGHASGLRVDDSDTCTALAHGTKLCVGRIAFAAEGPAFALPPDDGGLS